MVDIGFMQYVAGAIMVVGGCGFAMGVQAHKLYLAYRQSIADEMSLHEQIFSNVDYGHCTCGGCGRVVPMKNNWETKDHDCDFSLAQAVDTL